MEIDEIINKLEKSEHLKGCEILKVKKRKNYSITFVKQDLLESDLTGLYEGLVRILYRSNEKG